MSEKIKTKDVFRMVKCTFNAKEKIILGEQMAGCIREKNRLEDELGSIKKRYASDIGKQDAEIFSLAERLNTGWEMRRVECVEVNDFNTGSVYVYQKDVFGNISLCEPLVEQRPMNAEERQMQLQLGKGEEPSPETELYGDLDKPLVIKVGDLGLPTPEEIPHDTLQDAPETENSCSPVIGEGVIFDDLTEGMAETAEIIEKELKTLEEDANPFYAALPETESVTIEHDELQDLELPGRSKRAKSTQKRSITE